MSFPQEYHRGVQRLSSSTLFAVLAIAPLVSLLSSASPAQINGAPPSVTSPGFGGRAVNGTPPSVTSLGRNGYSPYNVSPYPFQSSGARNHFSHNGNHHRHYNGGDSYYPYVYALPVPYALDAADADNNEEDDDSYQGGPTIFDRRGYGRDSYIPPTYSGPAHARPAAPTDSTNAAVAAPPEMPQPETILVFRDGHQLEVGNYAIVGQTLYDLAPGHPKKVALADIDVAATQKQNDDRGITFELPPSPQAN